MHMRRRTCLTLVFITLLACAALVIAHAWIHGAPTERLAAGATYPDMPTDHRHHYIDLPLDHADPARGTFRGFYLLSPRFRAGGDVTFLLTDGQMELVGLRTDFGFFDAMFGSTPYVLIGVRGHAPTLLPEAYRNGQVDHALAMQLYGSRQQVGDIEAVRLDMRRKGLLPKDGRINVFGASGAGVLAQQYVSAHGAHVKRLLLESTGAPDLSRRAGQAYSPDFDEYNPTAAKRLAPWLRAHPQARARVANVLYQQGRDAADPRQAQQRTVEALANGRWLWTYELSPRRNLALLRYIVQTPDSLMARVRWFELVGADLLHYDRNTRMNLLYELSSVAVSDMLAWHRRNHVAPMRFRIDRRFPGEVLILKGRDDVVFGDASSELLRAAYPNARLVYVAGGHRLVGDDYRGLRLRFLGGGFAGMDAIAANPGVLEHPPQVGCRGETGIACPG